MLFRMGARTAFTASSHLVVGLWK